MQMTSFYILFYAMSTLFGSFVKASDVELKISNSHPSWENSKLYYTQTYDALAIIGTIPEFRADQWKLWGENVKNLSYHKNVTSVLLNHGSVSRELAEYLCNFENIEDVTLGISVEGVIMSEETFKVFNKMKKLKHLHIAIHGITDQYFQNITDVISLESIIIQFPDKKMIPDRDLYLWSKTSLSDLSVREIAKMHNLRSISISSCDNEYANVNFSITSIEAILKLPNLRNFHMATSHLSLNGGSLNFIREPKE
jgi:hypothetical protein